ncbi:ArsR/SmtB family transcription factor [Butyrivibrio sp. XPD2006]|uniref:ArsR/SmtB family transcription factor n=1 Tax=Butyrivibrio sp. XPD2006 TaxID=1280668 RepID=UPI000420CEC2|nr:helix-turn-helix domain-containing protein [Butyrivibrio sp. XPD2006]
MKGIYYNFSCYIRSKHKTSRKDTLSHHMKILVDSGLVNDRKEGKWHYYSINTAIMKEFCGFIKTLCNETTGKCCKE